MVVLKGVTLGNDVIVGAGSVVTKDLPQGAIAVGNPACVIKYRTSAAPVSLGSFSVTHEYRCCDFIHQGEESELCARIWAAGYEVHAFPGCRVHHWVSPESRNYRRMGFYSPRNRVLNHLLHTPLLWLPFELVRSLASYSRLSWQTQLPLTHLHGLMAGMQHGVMHWHQRQPLPLELYRLLMALPISA